jgi:cytidylate kinase
MKINKKNLQIAIDGPIGTGKSTLAYALSKKLKMVYIYTGVMYRTVAWLALRNNILLDNDQQLLKLIKKQKLELKRPTKKDRSTNVYLSGKDITNNLFTKEVSEATPKVAELRKIREYLVKIQKDLAKNKAVVMDGRDIGSHVLPKADLKIFLDANLKTRVKRRWQQLNKIKKPRSFSQVLSEIKKRDYEDSHRQVDPLKCTPYHWRLDTSKLSLEQEIDMIITKLKAKKLIS